jgi:hypothetical protein
MDEMQPKNKISPAGAWLNSGQSYAINPEKRKTLYTLINKGSISAENAVFVLLGMANKIADDYFKNKKDHFSAIDSLFFFKKKKMQEAEHLNYLGIADKILSDSKNYITGMVDESQSLYIQELSGVIKKLELETICDYKEINAVTEIARLQIEIIGKELFCAYLNPEGDIVDAKEVSFVQKISGGLMTSNILNMKIASDKMQGNEKAFPYASMFLDKHVFEKLKKPAYESLDTVIA